MTPYLKYKHNCWNIALLHFIFHAKIFRLASLTLDWLHNDCRVGSNRSRLYGSSWTSDDWRTKQCNDKISYTACERTSFRLRNLAIRRPSLLHKQPGVVHTCWNIGWWVSKCQLCCASTPLCKKCALCNVYTAPLITWWHADVRFSSSSICVEAFDVVKQLVLANHNTVIQQPQHTRRESFWTGKFLCVCVSCRRVSFVCIFVWNNTAIHVSVVSVTFRSDILLFFFPRHIY
jgi:hypothetical protein